jgi:ribosomal protein S18 acetylase RimI-like enzyme
MKLVELSDIHLPQLMSWFENKAQLATWSGPNFRYPFTESTFKEDLNLTTHPSYSLLSRQGELLAFGQYYLRENRCHLGRLVVNPSKRVQGIVATLIAKLAAKGKEHLKVKTCSLFVFEDNTHAIRAYQRLGFKQSQYPFDMPLAGCIYMVSDLG